MKKRLLIIVIFSLFLVGCGRNNEKNVTSKIIKNFDNSSGYMLKGELEITNNDDIYNYDVDVSYEKKRNFYRVTFVNKSNDFKQIILKNGDGVFLYTPSLNKNFKFSNDWPYNNSQVYLFESVINDIKKDNSRTFKYKDDKYQYITKANYPNNSKITKQKIIFDKDYKLKMIVVYDNEDKPLMNLTVDNIKLSPKFNKDIFKLKKLSNKKDTRKTMNIDDVIYPLYIPSGTKLVDEKKVKKDNGQRVIMTYDGEKNFVLVEETLDVLNELTTIPSSGKPYQLLDTFGIMTNNSLSWMSGNLEYYLVSDVMSQEELIEIAQSMVKVESFK